MQTSTQVELLRLADEQTRRGNTGPALAAIAAARIAAEDRTDPLTGLVGRDSVIGNERRFERDGVGIIFVDVDGLKKANDEHGHEAGDKLIRKAATAIQSAMREGDQPIRWGGDEFVAIVGADSQDQLDGVHDRIQASLEQHHVSASIGSTMRVGDETLRQTIGRADQAMYEDKRARHAARDQQPEPTKPPRQFILPSYRLPQSPDRGGPER